MSTLNITMIVKSFLNKLLIQKADKIKFLKYLKVSLFISTNFTRVGLSLRISNPSKDSVSQQGE